ncbi:MAG: phosphate ABC transporter permease PstA [Bacillota bacterium]|nr:phosphate ABC transporter permease PstA [Bacillota bacterium]
MQRSTRKKAVQGVAFSFLWIGAIITIVVLLVIVGYILYQGVPGLSWEFLTQSPKAGGKEGGILPMLVNTIFLVIASLAIAIPVGVLSAVFLAEYAKQGRIVRLIRSAAENLAGIPSIIFGLFGFIFFGKILGLGWSLLNGALTAAIVVLPTIMRTSEEALLAVPQSYREGSLSLGATRWQTVTRVVLPAASPGILAGLMLSMGRIVGETAALIFTLGSADRIAQSLMDSARPLSVHLYILAHEGISTPKAFSTATVLIILVLILNLTAAFLVSRANKNRKTKG